MGITKIARNKSNAIRNWKFTVSAREAWSEILTIFKNEDPNYKVLLPSYIGWSPNEGSGIFDSVKNSGLDFQFYRMDSQLQINFDDLKNQIKNNNKCVVLLVHYFGFIDLNYQEIVDWLKNNNIPFVEDCAHAWLSDLIGGRCGRNGQYSFYSLHKILPVENGGMLVDNYPLNEEKCSVQPLMSLNFDLFSIFKKRIENYNYLISQLRGIDNLQIIHQELEEGICPQTLPVIVENFDRNVLYQVMNDKGIGMVSLYHTMIDELKNFDSEAAQSTSKKIINFPVHQDISFLDIDDLVIKLKEVF